MTQPTLFDPPAAPQTAGDRIAGWVATALEGRHAEPLLAIAQRAANAILDAQGSVAVWEVRIGLAHIGLLANDGTESLDALGALGRRMGLVAVGSERPPAWAMDQLEKSHGNRHTRWTRGVSRDA